MVVFSYEFSHDGYHEKKGRIFRVYKTDIYRDYQGSNKYATTPRPLVHVLEQQFPEAESATRLVKYSNTLIKADQEVFLEPNI